MRLTCSLALRLLEWELHNFPNVIGPDASYSDIDAIHFARVGMLQKMYLPFYKLTFHDVGLWEKVFFGPCASRDTGRGVFSWMHVSMMKSTIVIVYS